MTKKILLLSTLFFLGLSTYSDNTPCNLTDKGVVINGIRWATRNVDAPGTFAETPESPGMFFQWNRRKGWNAVDPILPISWGRNATGTEWETVNDPCPEGWRVPTLQELQLLNNTIGEWTTKNGVNGRFFGITPYFIFLPAVGFRNAGGMLGNVGNWGYYWSNTMDNTSYAWSVCTGSGVITDIPPCDASYAWNLWFGNRSNGINGRIPRAHGYSIRCVAK